MADDGAVWQKIGGNPNAPDTLPDSTEFDESFGDLPQQALAGFEAFNRARTLGISDHLEASTGLTTKENIEKRQQQNPITETVAGAIPGVAASIATGGFGLAAGAGAGLLRVAAGAAGEGALFGGAQAATDAVLGDPHLNAQKILSDVGMGAALGGGLGVLSHTLGALPAFLRKRGEAASEAGAGAGAEAGLQEPTVSPEQSLKDAGIPGPIDPTLSESLVSESNPEGSTFRQGVPLDSMSPEDAAPYVKGLNTIKPNASEIIQAGKNLDGAATPEAMLTDDPGIHRSSYAVATSPSPEGIRQANIWKDAWNTASGAVNRLFGPETTDSLAEVGERVKSMISDGFEAKAGPVKELYESIEDSLPGIPISEKSTQALGKTISNLIKEEAIASTSPEANFVNTYGDAISHVTNLNELQKFRTAMGRATSKETQYVSGLIKEKLDNLELSAIKRTASQMKTPEAQQKVLGLIDQIEQAKASYRALRDDMAQIGKPLWGNKKIYGPQDFLNTIDDMTPEVFAKRLFSKNNAKALSFMNENFPNAISELSSYEKAAIRKSASPGDVFNPKAALKAVDNLPKEVRNMMFNPKDQGLLKDGKLYFNNFLKDYNPSHTASALKFQDFLQHPISNTISGITQWGKDLGSSAFSHLKVNVNLTPEQQAAVSASKEKASKLSYLAKTIKRVNDTISDSSDQILSGTKAAILQPAVHYSDKKYDELSDKIQKLAGNPENLAHDMSETTQHLHRAAPGITQGIYQTTSQALKYMNDILPKPSPTVSPLPLDPKWVPTKTQKQSFMKSYDAIDNPLGVLKQVKGGVVSQEAMQAMQAVHPELLQEMRQTILSKMNVEKAKTLPYSRKLALAQFLGQPLDTSMSPIAILSNQATFSAPQLSKQNTPNTGSRSTLGGLKQLSFATRVKTATQNRDEGG